MEPTEQLSYILPTLSATVDRIAAAQLDDPTPCSDFNVHDVLDHMIVLGASFTYWFRGEDAPELEAPEVSDRVPAAEFREVMDDLLDAVKSPGAMERTISAPMGEMPGSVFARLVAFDGLVHGWDLASSTGLKFELPTVVIDSVDGFARDALTADMRDGDTFKEETMPPDNADAMERLAAFSGRPV
jgi:uncharacterized protein (TIGR03086 family)